MAQCGHTGCQYPLGAPISTPNITHRREYTRTRCYVSFITEVRKPKQSVVNRTMAIAT